MAEPHILEYFHKQYVFLVLFGHRYLQHVVTNIIPFFSVKDVKKDLKVKAKTPMYEFLATIKVTLETIQKDRSAETEGLRYQLMHMRDILERWKIVGLNRKLQIKPRKFEEYIDEKTGESKSRCVEVQLILKWVSRLCAMNLLHLLCSLHPVASTNSKREEISPFWGKSRQLTLENVFELKCILTLLEAAFFVCIRLFGMI